MINPVHRPIDRMRVGISTAYRIEYILVTVDGEDWNSQMAQSQVVRYPEVVSIPPS